MLSCLLALPLPVRADTLLFTNGDRLRGTIVSANADEIHFQTDMLGTVVVRTDHAVVLPEAGPTSPAGSSVVAPPSGMAQVRERAADDRGLPIDRPPSGRARPRPWNRQLEFGVTDQSGRHDRRDMAVRVDLTRSTERGEVRLHGRYLYGRADREVAMDKLGGSLRVRRGLTPMLFAQGQTRYERDSINQIRHDAEQSIGMGTSLVKRDGFSLSLGGGAAARFRDAVATRDGWSYLIDAFQELKFVLSQHVTLTQDLSIVMSPFQEDILAVKLNAAVSSAITETIKLVMRYELEYDHSLAPDARENQRLVTSFGYLF